MEEIYSNVDRSDSSNQKRSHRRGNQVSSSKSSKVLLSVSLVLALGVLSVQGIMYGDEGHRDKRATQCARSCTKINGLPCNPCTDGWTEHRGKCYFFSSYKHTWFESRDSCAAADSQLIVINNQQVHDFLDSNINESHWIGLNDLDTKGRWVWVNKQTLTETGVQFWNTMTSGPHELLNSSGENCASMGNSTGSVDKWFVNSCKDKKRYICAFKHKYPRPDDI